MNFHFPKNSSFSECRLQSAAMTQNVRPFSFAEAAGSCDLCSSQVSGGNQKLSCHVLFDFYFNKATTISTYLAVPKMNKSKLYVTFFFFQLFLVFLAGCECSTNLSEFQCLWLPVAGTVVFAGMFTEDVYYLLSFYCIFIVI